jgi:hypothetical protein
LVDAAVRVADGAVLSRPAPEPRPTSRHGWTRGRWRRRPHGPPSYRRPPATAWVSVQLTLGVDRFDVRLETPHAPGYWLYECIAGCAEVLTERSTKTSPQLKVDGRESGTRSRCRGQLHRRALDFADLDSFDAAAEGGHHSCGAGSRRPGAGRRGSCAGPRWRPGSRTPASRAGSDR